MEKKDVAKDSPGVPKGRPLSNAYVLHQAKGNASAGDVRVGFLSKKSEGRLRNVWQKRRCLVQNGLLHIFHGDPAKQPTKVNLLTCQVRPVSEEKLCFDVVSFRRTYHFQAECEQTYDDWISVLLNAKEAALHQELESGTKDVENQSVTVLQSAIVHSLRRAPGNERCCDCDSINDASWLSTNFGIIVCIECSGIHRAMGVHVSKIQSLMLDNLGTSQLLIAHHMSNKQFNSVLEAYVSGKLNPNSSMNERQSFIKAKYEKMEFIKPRFPSNKSIFEELKKSVINGCLLDLLSVFAEMKHSKIDVSSPLPTCLKGETILHYAILHDDGSLLHIVDFLIQNFPNLDHQTTDGNTALHYSVNANQTEITRILLRSGANPSVENRNKRTPLSIAIQKELNICKDLILHALDGKKSAFKNLIIGWELSQDEGFATDFSDEEILGSPNSPQINFAPSVILDSEKLGPGKVLEESKSHNSLSAVVSQANHSQKPFSLFGTPEVSSKAEKSDKILNQVSPQVCKALYDCKADNEDELSFAEGDLIALIKEKTDDVDWFLGYLLKEPTKSGLIPSSFVAKI